METLILWLFNTIKSGGYIVDKKNTFKSYMAAVYLRLSEEDEDLSLRSDKTESNSIVNQKALILKELDSMPEVTLFDIYIDDGYTGLNFVEVR